MKLTGPKSISGSYLIQNRNKKELFKRIVSLLEPEYTFFGTPIHNTYISCWKIRSKEGSEAGLYLSLNGEWKIESLVYGDELSDDFPEDFEEYCASNDIFFDDYDS